MKKPETCEQLLLCFPGDARSISDCLAGLTGRRIELTITDNAAVMVSARQEENCIRLRMHRIFLSAGTALLKELAGFLLKKKASTPLLRAFIRQNRGLIAQKPPRRIAIRPQGRHHDLLKIYDALNSEYFSNRVHCGVTWGQAARSGSGRITLGSYQARTRTIRINPALDRARVPRYFVAYVLYHEMLHADLGVREENGRRVVHPPEFRKREKLFTDYQRALDWERGNGR